MKAVLGIAGIFIRWNSMDYADSPAVADWGRRMASDEAKQRYKARAATAECVNAHSRNRGLQQFRVRGLAKVKCVVLFFALVHNLMRMASLAPEMPASCNC